MGKWDRDRRQLQRAPQIEERQRRVPARKDTKRWCRGKVGVDHQTDIRNNTYSGQMATCGPSSWNRGGWSCNEEEYCVQCGKILQWTLADNCTQLPCPTPTTPA